MTALVTGGSGFLGGHIAAALPGCFVLTRRPSEERHIAGDLAAGETRLPRAFDEVYHAAGLAHRVPRTGAEAEAFYQVNRGGTARLLEALDRVGPPQRFVLISSVAVYGLERGEEIAEDAPQRAADPYGESKRMAEDLAGEWGEKRGVRVAIVRPPLIAGYDPPGNLGAMIRALRARRYFRIGDGSARRSMVWATDLAAILPRAAAVGGVFHLTDGLHPSFRELDTALSAELRLPEPRSLPPAVARALALAGDIAQTVMRRPLPFSSRTLSKMTESLTFSDRRARDLLQWSPRPVARFAGEMIHADR